MRNGGKATIVVSRYMVSVLCYIGIALMIAFEKNEIRIVSLNQIINKVDRRIMVEELI